MDTKEYIESGILEAYVLGALPQEERLEVEAARIRYPEVAAEIAAIEATMLQIAEDTAVTPPAFLQEQLWDALRESGAVNEEPERHQPKVIPFTGSEQRSQSNWQRAAIWIALIGSLLTNFILWYQKNGAENREEILAARVDSMDTRQNTLASRVEMFEHERTMLLDTGMKTVVLRSTQPDKGEMGGMVFFSKAKGDAYLALHNMPMPPQGKQYQLWVIQDGKPVDMGVIPNDMVASNGMQKVAALVSGGQAFAISLEKEGGSPVPTMEQIMVMGAVGS